MIRWNENIITHQCCDVWRVTGCVTRHISIRCETRSAGNVITTLHSAHSSLNRQFLNPPHLRLSLMLRMSKCQFHFILWEWELCCAVAYHIYWKPTLQLWIASLGWLADTLNSLSHDMKTLSETQAPLNRNVWLRNFEWAECQAKICRPYKITLVLIFQGLGLRDLHG